MTLPIVEKILSRPELLKNAYPPVPESDLQATEKLLGFELPSLLREIYLTVGNGGFGPNFGGFNGGENGYNREENIVNLYTSFRSEPEVFLWPERLLPFFDWGCACRCCLDCSVDNGAVVYFDPVNFVEHFDENDRHKEKPIQINPVPAFRKDQASLADWIEAWLDGSAMMAEGKPRWHPENWTRPLLKRESRKIDRTAQYKLEL